MKNFQCLNMCRAFGAKFFDFFEEDFSGELSPTEVFGLGFRLGPFRYIRCRIFFNNDHGFNFLVAVQEIYDQKGSRELPHRKLPRT